MLRGKVTPSLGGTSTTQDLYKNYLGLVLDFEFTGAPCTWKECRGHRKETLSTSGCCSCKHLSFHQQLLPKNKTLGVASLKTVTRGKSHSILQGWLVIIHHTRNSNSLRPYHSKQNLAHSFLTPGCS